MIPKKNDCLIRMCDLCPHDGVQEINWLIWIMKLVANGLLTKSWIAGHVEDHASQVDCQEASDKWFPPGVSTRSAVASEAKWPTLKRVLAYYDHANV